MNAWTVVVSAALGKCETHTSRQGTEEAWLWFPVSGDGRGYSYGVKITAANGEHCWQLRVWRHEAPARYAELLTEERPTDREVLDLVRLAGLLHPSREQVPQ